MTSVPVEYIWLGGKDTYNDIRSKTRTLKLKPNHNDKKFSYNELNKEYLPSIPQWNFDGSSTNQASSDGPTEILLKPCAICPDPFRRGLLVLCDCYLSDEMPHSTNTRFKAAEIFHQYEKEVPWFGLEQEYVLFSNETKRPVGWIDSEPESQGKYYCGNGADKVFARKIIEEHYQSCLHSKLSISGYNAEVMPGQYEYQIGPVEGIRAADQLIFARYIMLRICETSDIIINYEPKPVIGDWNGSGLHHNFSTQLMRSSDGYVHIEKAIGRLSEKHIEHIEIYGKDNKFRLTGKHETSSMEVFTWGVGTRNTSIRIPNETRQNQKGYLEDRRPSANADPYLSTSKLFLTCVE
jgi:glutamine synthetase